MKVVSSQDTAYSPLENLFRMRPTGVTLKKRMVPFMTLSSSLLCRLLDDQLTPSQSLLALKAHLQPVNGPTRRRDIDPTSQSHSRIRP